MKQILLSICMIALGSLSICAQSNASLQVVNRFQLEGDGHWDYLSVDEVSNVGYISHGDQVQVINLVDGKTVGIISQLSGVHGIAIASDLNKGFISNGKSSKVTVFDLKTYQTLAEIDVTGIDPDAIVYDAPSHQVFTFNGHSSNATVIDAKTNKVKATIALAGKPEFAVTGMKGKLFVNIEDKSLITEINTKTLKVTKSWSIAPGESPSGLALDAKNERLFSVCDNGLMVVSDAEEGKVITTLPIGASPDGVAFDANLKRIYSSNGEGTITVVQEKTEDDYSVLETVNTQKGARTIAINNKTHHVYLPTAEFEAAAPSQDGQHHRPSIKAGTFTILDLAIQ